MPENSDPTKDSTFQKVVGYFLRTPPKPRETKGEARRPKDKPSDNKTD